MRRRRKKTFEKPAFRIKKKSEKIYYLSTDPLQQNQKKNEDNKKFLRDFQ
jgi:hypothetical protein